MIQTTVLVLVLGKAAVRRLALRFSKLPSKDTLSHGDVVLTLTLDRVVK